MRTIEEHWPLIKVLGPTILSLAAAISVHTGLSDPFRLSGVNFLWFACGVFYTHLFEYFYHKFGMHDFPDPRHLRHHEIFTGANFQSRNAGDLQEIATEWYIFPRLFAVHYFAFLLLFPGRFAPAFFAGVTCQFLVYETTHWLTHLKNNTIDKIIARVPLLSGIRARQIEHHRIHHEPPVLNFNFTPPYAGDRFSGTYSRGTATGS